MTINNLGMIGNAFKGSYNILGYPSCEFPANSGVEHLFQGGLWIGALINGSQVAVSSGATDDASGYTTGKSGFEFTAGLGTIFIDPNFSISLNTYFSTFLNRLLLAFFSSVVSFDLTDKSGFSKIAV